MLQAANTDLFNPLVTKAHNSIVSVKIYYYLCKLCKKSAKACMLIFIFCTLSTNGLIKQYTCF